MRLLSGAALLVVTLSAPNWVVASQRAGDATTLRPDQVCISSAVAKGSGSVTAAPLFRTASRYVRLPDGGPLERVYFWTVARLESAERSWLPSGHQAVRLRLLLKTSREDSLIVGRVEGFDAVAEDAYQVALRRRWSLLYLRGEAFSSVERAVQSAMGDRRPFYRRVTVVLELSPTGEPAVRRVERGVLAPDVVDCIAGGLGRSFLASVSSRPAEPPR